MDVLTDRFIGLLVADDVLEVVSLPDSLARRSTNLVDLLCRGPFVERDDFAERGSFGFVVGARRRPQSDRAGKPIWSNYFIFVRGL
jgi:hypothetical protein